MMVRTVNEEKVPETLPLFNNSLTKLIDPFSLNCLNTTNESLPEKKRSSWEAAMFKSLSVIKSASMRKPGRR